MNNEKKRDKNFLKNEAKEEKERLQIELRTTNDKELIATSTSGKFTYDFFYEFLYEFSPEHFHRRFLLIVFVGKDVLGPESRVGRKFCQTDLK